MKSSLNYQYFTILSKLITFWRLNGCVGCRCWLLIWSGERFSDPQHGKGSAESHPSSRSPFTLLFYRSSPPVCVSCRHQVLGRRWEPERRCLRFQNTVLCFLLPLWRTSRRPMKTSRWRSPGNSSSRRAAWSAAQGCPASAGWVATKKNDVKAFCWSIKCCHDLTGPQKGGRKCISGLSIL